MLEIAQHEPSDIELFGRPFRIDDLDSLNLRSGQGFENEELAFVQKFVMPDDTCIDIGANIGLFTVALARAAGTGGRVYSFEPDPDNFAILQHNALTWRDTSDVRTFRLACGGANEISTLHRSTENRGMHRLYESPCCRGERVEVQTVIVDEIVEQIVRLVKIDIEGYEPFAVHGLAEIIRRSPQIGILTEFSPLSMMDAGSSATTYLKTLLDFGLLPHRIQGNDLTPLDVGELQSNCAALDSGDFASMRARCFGLDSAGIFAVASSFAEQLGFRGSIIENLFFARENISL